MRPERGLLCLSGYRSSTVSHSVPFCYERVAKGDDCSSRRGSAVVEFKIYLAQRNKKSAYSVMADSIFWSFGKRFLFLPE